LADLTDELACEVCSFLGGLHFLFGSSSYDLDESYAPFSRDYSNSSDEVVLFPGSFSPWHSGHEACLKGHSKAHSVIIPDYNPWKEVRENSIWSELKSLWVLALENKDVSIFSGFLAKKLKNPTVSWLPSVKVSKKWLLMGDDSFLSFNQWKDVDILIASLTGILVCPRLGNQADLQSQRDFIQSKSDIEIEFLAPHDFQELSSTQIRNQK
jgi:nicotinate-nucleotide adenylyltransferase